MKFANLATAVSVKTSQCSNAHLKIEHCLLDGSRNVNFLLHSYQVNTVIVNSTFSNNIGGKSAILMYGSSKFNVINNSKIVDNNMTGLTLISSTVRFAGYNVIQNNSNIDGAGIALSYESNIVVDGELFLCNNTAYRHGGGIFLLRSIALAEFCTLRFSPNSQNSRLIFQENRAGKGGSDTYGLQLTDCKQDVPYIQ